MRLPNELRNVVLDVECGALLINGERIDDVDQFILEFKSGEWSLAIRQHKSYCAGGRATFDSAAHKD